MLCCCDVIYCVLSSVCHTLCCNVSCCVVCCDVLIHVVHDILAVTTRETWDFFDLFLSLSPYLSLSLSLSLLLRVSFGYRTNIKIQS